MVRAHPSSKDSLERVSRPLGEKGTVPFFAKSGQFPAVLKPVLGIVRETLQAYADRGVFRGFCEHTTRRGLPAFRFRWLTGRPMELTVDTARHVLRFQQILPGVPARSPLYAQLKGFIADRHDRDLPEHRRVDERRAAASCINRAGLVSILLEVKHDQYAYGTNRIVNLVHELFVYLRDRCPEYLAESFDVPEE